LLGARSNRVRLLRDSCKAPPHAIRTSYRRDGVLVANSVSAARFLTSREAMQASSAMGGRSQSRSSSKGMTSKFGGAGGGSNKPEKACAPREVYSNVTPSAPALQAKDDTADVPDPCICGDGLNAQLACPAPRRELSSRWTAARPPTLSKPCLDSLDDAMSLPKPTARSALPRAATG